VEDNRDYIYGSLRSCFDLLYLNLLRLTSTRHTHKLEAVPCDYTCHSDSRHATVVQSWQDSIAKIWIDTNVNTYR